VEVFDLFEDDLEDWEGEELPSIEAVHVSVTGHNSLLIRVTCPEDVE
jgi:hypothetical protein